MTLSAQETLVDLRRDYEDTIARRTPKSRAQHERAKCVLPGGVVGDGRTWLPLHISQGAGSKIVDIDGNSYVDLVMGFGANILGHAPTRILEVAHSTIDAGIHFGISTPLEEALARQIRELVPTMELMRFVPTGSEATMMALRAARAFTGRGSFAKFEGHFHGQSDAFLVSTMSFDGPATAPRPVRDCGGLMPAREDETLILSWGDTDATLRQITEHSEELAAVIMEPVPVATMSAEPPEAGFLRALRDITSELGILLIFDEVVNGFRLSLGGAAAYFGVAPDLHTFGKVVGGGFPIGVYGGRRDVMSAVLESADESLGRRIYQSGTFSGLPVAMAAGLATLQELATTDALEVASRRASDIRQGWRRLSDSYDVGVQVTGIESHLGVFFADRPIRTRRDILASNIDAARVFALGLLAQGVYLPPIHPGVTSAAHTAGDVEDVLEASKQVFADMAGLVEPAVPPPYAEVPAH